MSCRALATSTEKQAKKMAMQRRMVPKNRARTSGILVMELAMTGFPEVGLEFSGVRSSGGYAICKSLIDVDSMEEDVEVLVLLRYMVDQLCRV